MIKNIREAYSYFKEFLKSRSGEVIRCIPKNFGRHRLIIAKLWYRGSSFIAKFYLVYQREWFEKFDKFYNYPAKACTLNLSILNELVKSNIDRIVFVNKDGQMLMISPREFLKIAKERGWVRKTRKTGEEVAHIPITFLRPLEFSGFQNKLEKYFR